MFARCGHEESKYIVHNKPRPTGWQLHSALLLKVLCACRMDDGHMDAAQVVGEVEELILGRDIRQT